MTDHNPLLLEQSARSWFRLSLIDPRLNPARSDRPVAVGHGGSYFPFEVLMQFVSPHDVRETQKDVQRQVGRPTSMVSPLEAIRAVVYDLMRDVRGCFAVPIPYKHNVATLFHLFTSEISDFPQTSQ